MGMEVSSLSRELYPFLLSLKQDLQFVNNDINNKRIEKSYFQPLSITLKNKNKEGEKMNKIGFIGLGNMGFYVKKSC